MKNSTANNSESPVPGRSIHKITTEGELLWMKLEK